MKERESERPLYLGCLIICTQFQQEKVASTARAAAPTLPSNHNLTNSQSCSTTTTGAAIRRHHLQTTVFGRVAGKCASKTIDSRRAFRARVYTRLVSIAWQQLLASVAIVQFYYWIVSTDYCYSFCLLLDNSLRQVVKTH